MRRSESIDLEQATYTVTYFVADSLMVTYTVAPRLTVHTVAYLFRDPGHSCTDNFQHIWLTVALETCRLEIHAMLGLFLFWTRQVVEKPCEARTLGCPFLPSNIFKL